MLGSLFGKKKTPNSNTPIEAPDISPKPASAAKPNKPTKTSYVSKDIPIPPDFLTTDPPDLQPITITPINWAATKLPEYEGYYAVVLDNVISPSECETLLKLAEASVPDSDKTPPEDGTGSEGEKRPSPWGPAMVNVGGGYEVIMPHYRNSDRIIWDQQEVVDRLWARCLRAEGLRERLSVIDNEPRITGPQLWGRRKGEGHRWEFRRVNQRMRFLKYGKGQFFKPHCDGPYIETDDDHTIETLFTVHLYLNDSQQEVGGSAELIGGATSFYSRDESRKIDVDPKAGRVLIFQHRDMLHSGDDVKQGIKYTMRTDLVYEMIRENK